MQNYVVNLESEVFKSFRCQKAADSLDIDVSKKSKHNLEVNADLDTKFNVGLIVGSSGSGKTTLAKKIFGTDCFELDIDETNPIIDQFDKQFSYDECANALMSIGLTSVPCWIRPVHTLSNGQRARAEAAIAMSNKKSDVVVIDEWTSVVDRTVAKVMSHCVAKHSRRYNKTVVLNSCHYDVIDWLNPDWIIDCNTQKYIDRRSMVGTFERTDRLRFDIKEVDRNTWRCFSKYHYLSDRLPGGKIFTFGLFHNSEQIGFTCFAAYIIGDQNTYFTNRTTIHPDFCGLGIGINFTNETSKIMVQRGYKIKSKASSIPMYKSRSKSPLWKLTKVNKNIAKLPAGKIAHDNDRAKAMRRLSVTYSFDFVWKP